MQRSYQHPAYGLASFHHPVIRFVCLIRTFHTVFQFPALQCVSMCLRWPYVQFSHWNSCWLLIFPAQLQLGCNYEKIHSALVEGLNNDLKQFVMFSWFHRQLLKSLSAVIDVDSTPDRHKLEELKLSLHQLCHCFLSICSLKQGNGLTDHLLHFAVMSKWCFCSVFLLFHSVKHHWCYCLVLWIHAIGVGLFSTSSQNREQIIHSRL